MSYNVFSFVFSPFSLCSNLISYSWEQSLMPYRPPSSILLRISWRHESLIEYFACPLSYLRLAPRSLSNEEVGTRAKKCRSPAEMPAMYATFYREGEMLCRLVMYIFFCNWHLSLRHKISKKRRNPVAVDQLCEIFFLNELPALIFMIYWNSHKALKRYILIKRISFTFSHI